MEVEQHWNYPRLDTSTLVASILQEWSTVTDYRTLRDSLPRRLAALLKCRCVLLYQRIGETLQFASGSFDDTPGWSTPLLSLAHINPVDLHGDTPEALSWRSRRPITVPDGSATPTGIVVPLLYRHHAIGVLVGVRGIRGSSAHPSCSSHFPDSWVEEDIPVVEAIAGVVALLLENTRLLERDRERIAELSLLNTITSQLHASIYDFDRIKQLVIHYIQKITSADHCELILASTRGGDTCTADSEISPALIQMLFTRFNKQVDAHPTPFMVEPPGNSMTNEYVPLLPASTKTFFAIPLLIRTSATHAYPHGIEQLKGLYIDGASGQAIFSHSLHLQRNVGTKNDVQVAGMVVGVYHRLWKLRHEEQVLLQVLASQTGTVLENMYLMTEVIDARNEARKLLRQVLDDQRLKELILESMPSGLIAVDLNGRITTFNTAAENIMGYTIDEVMGQPLHTILALHIPFRDGNSRSPLPANQTRITVDRQGQEIMLDLHFAPLNNDQGVQIGTLITFTDVTSLYQLEEEKRRLDRLASLGEMSASVAHEVRNPLASIKTSMQMLLYDLEEHEQQSGDAREAVSVVLQEVMRLDTIVRDLLLFARPRQLHRVPCNMVELSDHVLHVMQAQYTEMGISIQRCYQDVPMIQVDMAQMEQILFNLYTNAMQAMPDGGVLTLFCQIIADAAIAKISAEQEKDTRATVINGTLTGAAGKYGTQQQWLEVAVQDTGTGIAPDQLERIFQPFFTTKAHGIGLGLPITRRLVEDHRGHLLVQSQPGHGTIIALRLPLEDENENSGMIGDSIE